MHFLNIYRFHTGSHVIHWVYFSIHNSQILIDGVDVVKSRIQLRAEPPKGSPIQYIVRELREIVIEAGR